jgi:MOSC domain-containing protein YiiM
MKKIGEVLQLFISKKGSSTRLAQEVIQLDKGGILGDKFYDKDPQRSILLTSQESYTLAKNHDIHLQFGQLGENILMDYNPYLLPLNSQLKMGETLLEITQNCTICKHLSIIDKALPKLLAHDRGIFVRVLQGGNIQCHDAIYLL